MARDISEKPYKKPRLGDFILWCLKHLVLTLITFGLWLLFYNFWILYKLDRATD